ncbi:MAG: Two-component hybrid sensor and regulator [Acidobacteria bacterium]|nr:Two-component hybrid sensor and regulator [Acidobacteriota bacterium]
MSAGDPQSLSDPAVALRALLGAAAPGFVYFVDVEGRYAHVSETGAAILGLTPGQMIGRSWTDVGLPPDREAEFAAERERILRSGESSRREVSFPIDGVPHHFDLTVTPVYDDDRRPLGVLVTSSDVTETKRAAEGLQESEVRYAELANAMPQIVWTARADGRIDFFNDRWYEYTGRQRGADDVETSSVLAPEEYESVVAKWQEAVRTGQPYDLEARYRSAAGDYRWFLARAVPVRDAGGNVIRWYGTSTDIDEQKRNEAELSEERATAEFLTRANDLFAQSLDYEKTLANLADMVVPILAEWCSVDMIENGRIRGLAVAHEDPAKVAVAYEYQQRFPAMLDDEGGIANIVRSGKIEWVPEISREMLEAGVPDRDKLEILRQLDLRSYIGAPIVIRGHVVGVLTLIGGSSRAPFDERDVWMASELTQRAAHAIENARLYSDAVDANRVKDEFLATLSHELRTPLTAILGWARMLRMGGIDAESMEIAVETIETSAIAQSALIDDILDVSRIMAGKFKLELADVDARDVVQNAIASSRPAAEAKGVALDVSVPQSPMEVHGDANRLQQIVWNLVSNAVKFTASGGRVAVRVTREDALEGAGEGHEIVLTVTDTGRGITPEFLPHVFERFRQFDSSTTRQYGGLGLGLSIVRHLAELHGGSVTASSAGEGRGSTFTVRLPAARSVSTGDANADGAQPADRVTDDLRRRLHGARVLVVDDDAGARSVLSAMLRQFGASVDLAGSAAEALECLGRTTIDVVISDIAMTGEDGYALLRRIRGGENGHRDVPVIAVTALAETSPLLRAGFDAFLQKPVEPHALAAAVAERLRGVAG